MPHCAPSLMRAVGSQVEADGRDITVYLSRPQSRHGAGPGRHGHVAVVFSVPSTHRSVQLKASRVEMRNADADDAPVLARYLASMEHEVQQVGFAPPLTRAMLAHRLEDLVAVRFTRAGLRPDARAARRHGHREHGERPHLQDIRCCFEGYPATVATCSAEGVPNVAYISQVFYADERHVALSFQFFNKTRQNILANPYATALVLDPGTAQFYRLSIRYQRTETSGPLFEHACAAGRHCLAQRHAGRVQVARLRRLRGGADRGAGGRAPAGAASAPSLLGAVRRARSGWPLHHLDETLNGVLASLNDHLGIRHAMVLMLDPAAQRLYTVASCGYPPPAWAPRSASGKA